MTHDIGDRVRLYAQFLNDSLVSADPAVVRLRIKHPDTGTVTTHTYPGAGTQIVKVSVGNYRLDLTPDFKGRWDFRWEGDDIGGVASMDAAEPGMFAVRASNL